MLLGSSASPEGMGEVVREGKGKEGKQGRHTTHTEGLGEAHKWHGKGSVLSQTTLLFYRDSPTFFFFFETTFFLLYFDFKLDFNFFLRHLGMLWCLSLSLLLQAKQYQFFQTVIIGQLSQAFDHPCRMITYRHLFNDHMK